MLTIEHFERLLEISRQLAETRELDPLLNAVMDFALELMQAEYGYLVLLHGDNEVEYRVRRERVGVVYSETEAEISRSIVRQVVDSRQPVITPNAFIDETFSRAKSVQIMRLRSVICVPLFSRTEVIGALYVENRSEADMFRADDLKVMQFFAAQASVAIENAQLNEALEERVARRTAALHAANQRLTEEIAERKRAEQEVLRLAVERERAQVLATFIRDASHEFRTPLTLIHTSLHLLSKVRDEQRRLTYIERIEEQTQVILRLVEALVLMSRLDSGEPLRRQLVDINMLVSTSVARYEAEIAARDIRLQIDYSPALPRLLGSAEELAQALDKILDNAVKYTPANGLIALRTLLNDGQLIIEISDSGSGISDQDLPHIFERFYRGDQAHTSRGFGLGLPIAHKIIERHLGHIVVETDPTRGTTFRLVLPVSAPQPVPA